MIFRKLLQMHCRRAMNIHRETECRIGQPGTMPGLYPIRHLATQVSRDIRQHGEHLTRSSKYAERLTERN
jgi:hypothetical protein